MTTPNSVQDPATTERPSAEALQAEWDAQVAERTGADPARPAASELSAKEDSTPAQDNPAEPAKGAAAPPLDPIAQQLTALAEATKRIEDAWKRTEGRVGALQSKIAKEPAPAAAEQPSAEQVALAVEDPVEWKKLQEEFPEWGTAIQKKLEVTAQALLKRIGAGSGAVKQDVIDAAVSMGLQSREYARLERAHPGWRKLTNTPAYTEWYGKQTADTQALADSPWSEDAIEFFDKFKKDTVSGTAAADADALRAQRQKVLDTSAITKQTRPTAPRAPGSDQDLTAEELWKQEAESRNRRRAA